jgi:TM2 domain-containing membrane protein YozV
VQVLEDRSPKSYATAVALSSALGFVGLQHFYLGRFGEGLIDLLLTAGWVLAAANEQWALFALLLVTDGAHALWATIALLTGNYRDGNGLRVCYPGQRVGPRQIA